MTKKGVSLRNVDNVGKAFVAIQNQKSSKVFRISCELFERIDGETLNQALQHLICQFSFFQVELKNGFLWPYLIKSNKLPVAAPEIASACAQLYRKGEAKLLYEVTYRDNWIHLEIFHALTDGVGASYFLRMLAIAYLMVHDGQDVDSVCLAELVGLPHDQYELDGYEANYVEPNLGFDRAKTSRAYQINAPVLRTNANIDYRLVIDTNATLDICHEMGVSAAELFTAVFVKSFYDTIAQESTEHPVSIAIPVNLRKMFACTTARNFFALIKTRHPIPSGSYNLENILEIVHNDFVKSLQPTALQQNFSQFIAIERSKLRFVPLPLKTMALRFSEWVTAKSNTAILSNLGRMEMPAEFARHIKAFDLMDKTEGIKLCVISYGKEMSLHFTSAMDTSAVQQSFVRTITDLGIPAQDFAQSEDISLPRANVPGNRRGTVLNAI